MSWFGASNSSLDEQVEKATSSSLEDIALNLEISDIIRSRTVQPKEAMRSLRRRIGNKNPNVQLAALNLTDTCVKNGGSHFLAEIASREFMDNLVSLLKAPGAINNEVKSKLLELIQLWASAFEGNPQLGYVKEVCQRLKAEGYDFPPPTKVSSTFVDSSAPPDWIDSDVCMRCRTAFTFTNRKHHCRNCGSVFCGACSSKSIPLPHIGIVQPVRVCDGCHTKLTEKKIATNVQSPKIIQKRLPSSAMQPRNARVEQEDDEDLKMALKMSLADMGRTSSAYAPQPHPPRPHMNGSKPASNPPSTTPPGATGEDEEDAELKAAIAASLRDMEEQKAKSAWKNTTSISSEPVVRKLDRPEHELTPAEAENINLFATLVDRLQSQPPGTILREPQIQELYESIGALRPKLARTFGETMSKYETLCDLHAKLGTVVRYYDRMLEERLSYTYGRHGLGGTPAPYQPPSVNQYPNAQGPESYYGTGGGGVSTAPQSPAVQPQQTYQNYYGHPQGFEPPAPYTASPSTEPQTLSRQPTYPQFHSSEPYQQPAMQAPSNVAPSEFAAHSSTPSSQQHAPYPQQNPVQHSSGPPDTAPPAPVPAQWQYSQNSGPKPEPQYNLPQGNLPQSQQAPWSQGATSVTGPYGGPSYPLDGTSFAAAQDTHQHPKPVEESLIDL